MSKNRKEKKMLQSINSFEKVLNEVKNNQPEIHKQVDKAQNELNLLYNLILAKIEKEG